MTHNSARVMAESPTDAHRNLFSAIVSRAIADLSMRSDSREAFDAAKWILDRDSHQVPFSFVWLMDNLGYARTTYGRIYERARTVMVEYYE